MVTKWLRRSINVWIILTFLKGMKINFPVGRTKRTEKLFLEQLMRMELTLTHGLF